MDRIRVGWAELLTGRATLADVLNVLFAMAETALDKRQPQSVADRAAVRLGAAIRHNAYLLAAPKETESQSLQVYGQSLQTEHPHPATRYLEEEASKGCKTARRDKSSVAHFQLGEPRIIACSGALVYAPLGIGAGSCTSRAA